MSKVDSNSVKLILLRSFSTLTKKEQKNIFLVIVIQIFLAVLDLLGVLIFGLLGSLAVNGLSSNPVGNKTQVALEIFKISTKPLQQQVFFLAVIATVILTFKTIFSLYFTKKSLYFLSRRAAQLSSNLISKLLSQSLIVIQEKSTQQTIYMVTSGISTITVGIIGSIVYLISDISLLVIMLLGLFLVDPIIAFTTLLLFGAVAISLYRIMHEKMEKFGKIQTELTIESAEKISDVIGSYRELFVKDRRSFYAKEIGDLRFKLANVLAENTFYQNINKYVLEITIIVGVLIISAIQFSTHTTSRAVAIMSIFLIASLRIGPAVLRVQQVFSNIVASIGIVSPTLDLIEKFKNSAIDISDGLTTFNYTGFNPLVSLKNVSFSYPLSSGNAISNVTIDIAPRTITAIVGPSGAGKTTLVDLILGVINPSSGVILINDQAPIEAIKKFPGAISYVPQDIIVTNGTIEENVTLGYQKDIYTKDMVINALKAAQLTEFVSSLPNGLETHVGDRGTKISGGQRQRLGIARAIFTSPSLLILDEATSSLDGITEANVSESIQKLRGSATVIMIAHRLSTVRNSDLVIYMDQGKIIAAGNFKEVREKVSNFDEQAKIMGL